MVVEPGSLPRHPREHPRIHPLVLVDELVAPVLGISPCERLPDARALGDRSRHIFELVTPGLVFASGPGYARAITAVAGADVPVVLTEGEIPGRQTLPFAQLLAATPGRALEAAHDAVGPDTIAKLLFTSGSTKAPKGVITTHRMMCSNQQMIAQVLPSLAAAPPVLVDWLPWNHTAGSNHNLGLVLYHGGTLYIDDGKPVPGQIDRKSVV